MAETSRSATPGTGNGETMRDPPSSGVAGKTEETGDVTVKTAVLGNRDKVFSEAARRRSMKVPKEGIMMSVTSVMDIYQQVRMLVGMVANVWGWSMQTTTSYKQVIPGLVRVNPGVGKETFVMPGFYLQDIEYTISSTPSSPGLTRGTTSSKSMVQDVTLKHTSRYFTQVKLLLKIRWLLRLHSAGCELDYKMCSLRNLILGMQYVVLQQCAEVECDSIFDSKVQQTAGQHLNLESVIDDIADQLHRALGTAHKHFLEFVASCDPSRAVHFSKMESPITTPPILPNDQLSVALDTIFLTNFLRQPRKEAACKLQELYDELETLGLPQPEVPPLRGAQHLRAWAKAQTKPTRIDREKGSSKDAEKLAQLDAVLLTAAVELHLHEVYAAPNEIVDDVANNTTSTGFPNGDGVPEPVDFGSTGRAPGSAGPPAARVLVKKKPQLQPMLVDAAVHCIHHHRTFPEGIRERLYSLLNEEYGLTESQTQRLAIAATQNIDGKRLQEDTLLRMDHREKSRLRTYFATTWKDTSHLIVPSLVQGDMHHGKPARYTLSPPVPPPRAPYSSSFVSGDMTRSLPDFRSFTVKDSKREPFKVPLGTGPLTLDPDLRKLRTTGFFIKMPPLKGQ